MSNSQPGVRLVPRDVRTANDGPAIKRLHKTNSSERDYRDSAITAATRVAPRDERGEIPD